MSFGRFIAARRQRLGLTVREAARQVGVDHSRLVRWEGGEGAPRNAVRLHALAVLYVQPGETVDELLTTLTKLSVSAALGLAHFA